MHRIYIAKAGSLDASYQSFVVSPDVHRPKAKGLLTRVSHHFEHRMTWPRVCLDPPGRLHLADGIPLAV